MPTSIYDRDGNKVYEIISPTDYDDCEYSLRGDSLKDTIYVYCGVALIGLVAFGLLCLVMLLLA